MSATAVFTPVSATLPAMRTAWVTGSLEPDEAAGWRGGGVEAVVRVPVVDRVRALALVLVPFFRGDALARAGFAFAAAGLARCAAVAARGLALAARVPAPALERFELRRPGRDRGRLPRTPWSSLSFAATTRENSARAIHATRGGEAAVCRLTS